MSATQGSCKMILINTGFLNKIHLHKIIGLCIIIGHLNSVKMGIHLFNKWDGALINSQSYSLLCLIKLSTPFN